jgi:exonuclease III
MEEQDLLHLTILGYILGSSFCCKNLQKEGVCIFVRKDLYFSKINISHDCREKDVEICAIELETKLCKLIILSLYRAPAGDFNQFIKNLDDALKHQYKPKAEFLICGDINTEYLMQTNRKKQLASLLTTIYHTQYILQQELKIIQVLPLIIYLWTTVD